MRDFFLKIIAIIGTSVTLISGIYAIYHELIETKTPKLNIIVNSLERATKLSKVEGLETNFIFKGRQIKEFWVVDITLENISNATIIGKEDKKNIIGDSLALNLIRPYHLLDGYFISNDFNNISYLSTVDTVINFKFIQWRPQEKIKLRFYIEGDSSAKSNPAFWMNDRQIIDGEISYEEPDKKQYSGYIPSRIQDPLILFILGAVAILVFAELFAILVIISVEYIFRLYIYRKWKKSYYIIYKEKIN